MAKRYSLSAEPRTVLGKQVKQLRRQFLVPANIYGHKVEPVAITITLADFRSVHKQAQETGLIDLKISTDEKTRPALIHSMLVDPVNSALLHVDFYQVNLKEKLTASVPLEYVGESLAVKNGDGLLLELLQEVEVESLPTNIPTSIEVDISGLNDLDQGIHVSDLKLPEGVEMKTDPEELVCKIAAAQMAEEVEETVAETEATADDQPSTETESNSDSSDN